MKKTIKKTAATTSAKVDNKKSDSKKTNPKVDSKKVDNKKSDSKKTNPKVDSKKVVVKTSPTTTGTGYHVRKRVSKKGVEFFHITVEEKTGKGKSAEINEVTVEKFSGDNALNRARLALRKIIRESL